MKVTGVAMVRDEQDVLETNLSYHLACGIDEILVVDNGSSDATRKILQRVARRTGRVRWRSDPGEYRQSEVTTDLARDAVAGGADWVMVIDADEFWTAEGDLRSVLATTSAGVLTCPLVNFVQRRDQRRGGLGALRHMQRRIETPVGPLEATQTLVETHQIAFVAMQYPPKCVARASPEIQVHAGNHLVTGVPGSMEATDRIACLHAPLRSLADLRRKAEHGARVAGTSSFRPGEGWHVRRWRHQAEQGVLEDEWRANSYGDDGCLDVYGQSTPLIVDDRLARIAAAHGPGRATRVMDRLSRDPRGRRQE